MKISLRKKFLIPTTTLIVVGMGVLSMISFTRSKQALESSIINQVTQQANSISLMLDSWVKERQLNVKNWTVEKDFPLAVDDSWVDNGARKRSSTRLETLRADYGGYESLSLTESSGNVVASSNPDLIGKFSAKEFPFFKKAMAGKLFTGLIFASPSSGLPVFAVSAPVSMDGRTIGTLFALVDFTVFAQQFINSVQVGKGGFAYVLDRTGMVVSYPDSAKIYKLDASKHKAWKTLQAEERGMIRFSFDDREKVVGFKQVKSLGCTINVAAINDEIFSPVTALARTSLVSTLVISIFAALLIFLVCRSVLKPLGQIIEGLKDIVKGEGDLTKRIQVSSNDEMGELATWFNRFIEKLQAIISDVNVNSGSLNKSAESLTRIARDIVQDAQKSAVQSGNMTSAGLEMKQAISSVVAATGEAAGSIASVSAATEEMHATINQVAGSSARASEITANAVDQASEASRSVDRLGNFALEIGTVIGTISEISEQVNLLALNATIEAARAGDAGKGFAVVANEIKDLARQTKDATNDIKDKVTGIQTTTRKTVDSIKVVTGVIDDINDIVSSIAEAVTQQSGAAREIAGNISEVSLGVEEINTSMQQTSGVVENMGQEIVAVDQAARGMLDNGSLVTDSVADLFNLSRQLDVLVGQFRV